MDYLNASLFINSSLSPFIINDTSIVVWDNHTTGLLPLPPSSMKSQKYFWIGISFVGGLAIGFIMYILYFCLQKYVLSQIMDEPELRQYGISNLSFVGDDSRMSFTDPPPDYATIVSRNNSENGGASSDQKETGGFFSRLFKRSSGGANSNGTAASGVDEPPPSYSSVVPHIDADFSVRWQAADDGISFERTECPPSELQ
ncbi:hypothetical protein JTE90_006992 [Oedothorax gibbosus]|uniref:Uncharacterized protein n=1 Tax=Oedothorax gibbosus TaxID=931172 RepID=A0AAV6VB13_9ARAC|nr:hypothetical protein JTE90_006992 [Oedothorax gibbosus]